MKKISDEAYIDATGKTFDRWMKLLDKTSASEWDHKKIVVFLRVEFGVSDWWGQQITVDYERAIGRRVLGETKDAGFQIGVSKTLAVPREKLWRFLISGEGLKLWLGETDAFTPQPGSKYRFGEVRTVDPGVKIRLTYRQTEWEQSTVLQIYLDAKGKEKTSLRFHHEKLTDTEMREKMREYWKSVASKIEEAVMDFE